MKYKKEYEAAKAEYMAACLNKHKNTKDLSWDEAMELWVEINNKKATVSAILAKETAYIGSPMWQVRIFFSWAWSFIKRLKV